VNLQIGDTVELTAGLKGAVVDIRSGWNIPRRLPEKRVTVQLTYGPVTVGEHEIVRVLRKRT
jgi:preprotein translocase subunit YajC